MKEQLLSGLEKVDLKKAAEKLGVGNINKKSKEKLRIAISVYSYSQIVQALKSNNG